VKPIAVHGHRGARAVLPENTLAGFRYAIEAGADAIELDVLATRDDILVACHDPVLKRSIYTGPPGGRMIRNMTLAGLGRWRCCGEPMPALTAVLELAAATRVGLDLELKSFPARPELAPPPERFAALLAAAVEEFGMSPRVVALSFDLRVLAALARRAPGIRRGALHRFGAHGFARIARTAGTTVVAPYHRVVTRRRVEAAHRAGVEVIAWTANRPRDWERLARAGVDAIITDDPAGLLKWLRGRGLHD
jgi:glycerophosphoryl diester phosphodiesterase